MKSPLQQQKVLPWCLLRRGMTAWAAGARLPRALVGRVAVREAGRGRGRGGQQRRVDHVRDRLALRRAQQARDLRPLPSTMSVETGVGASSKSCPCRFAGLPSVATSTKPRFTASHSARLRKPATFNSCRTLLPKRRFVFDGSINKLCLLLCRRHAEVHPQAQSPEVLPHAAPGTAGPIHQHLPRTRLGSSIGVTSKDA